MDSSVWIDLLAGTDNLHTVWLERAIRFHRIGMPDLILCEVIRGIRSDDVFDQVRDQLRDHDVMICGGEAIAVAAAQNFRFLQKRGITVRKTIDCLIATFCIAEGHTLLHRDRDFDPFEKHLGLNVVHPQSQ